MLHFWITRLRRPPGNKCRSRRFVSRLLKLKGISRPLATYNVLSAVSAKVWLGEWCPLVAQSGHKVVPTISILSAANLHRLVRRDAANGFHSGEKGMSRAGSKHNMTGARPSSSRWWIRMRPTWRSHSGTEIYFPDKQAMAPWREPIVTLQ